MSAVTLADVADKTSNSGFSSIMANAVPFLLVAIVFYILVVKPQQKKLQEQQEVQSNLKVGDRILTKFDFYARVNKIHQDSITVEISKGLEIEISKDAIKQIHTNQDKPHTARKNLSKASK